jgi:glycosyltransferase involved in cell wall biosynthesis
MKLIVLIPCFNEAETLPATLRDIPRRIPGIAAVEVLVVDDGSSDGTAEVARRYGADHVVQNVVNAGLARAFRRGLDECIRLGADIIVNTDGDNQYCGGDIPILLAPILRGETDIVIGDRQTDQIEHFSFLKKQLQRIGSSVVRRVSGIEVPDAVSGFRAISRSAALRLNIVSSFSYTIEMLIQAGKKKIAVSSVPVRTNLVTRESRLFRNIPQFIERSLSTMLRMYSMYSPLRVFTLLSLFFFVIGVAPVTRFLFFFAIGEGQGHVQSLVLGGAFLVMGTITFLIGLVADLLSFNRQLLEICLEKIRALEADVKTQDTRR